MRRPGVFAEACQGRGERLDVVAVDLVDVPAEGAPPRAQWVEVEHVARVSERLLAVDIDDRDEVRQTVVGREHHSLPQRALVALRVAGHHVDRARRALQARSECGSRSDREALPERARREVDSGEGVLRVCAQGGETGAERRKLLIRQATGFVKSAVEGERRMTLRENEAVAVRIVRACVPERPGEEGGDDIRDRQARADVADVGAARLLDDHPPDSIGELASLGPSRSSHHHPIAIRQRRSRSWL